MGHTVRPRVRIAWSFLVGFVMSGAFLVLALTSWAVPPAEAGKHGYVHRFAPPSSGFETMALNGDGQAYASIALDPTLSRPDLWYHGAPSLAFFAQRPLLPYGVWLLSHGDEAWLPFGFVVANALAGGLVVAATSATLIARGRGQNPRSAWVVMLLPVVFMVQTALGPDLLGTGLAVAGIACWWAGPEWRRWAVVAFVVAVLARESMIVVPSVLILYDLVHRRARRADALLVVVPVVAYACWSLVVRQRLAAGPESVAGRASLATPLAGVVEGSSRWEPIDAVLLLLLFGALVVTVAFRWSDPEAWIIAAFLLGATLLHADVWRSWVDIARVMTPAAVLAVIVWLPLPAESVVRAPGRRALTPTAPPA